MAPKFLLFIAISLSGVSFARCSSQAWYQCNCPAGGSVGCVCPSRAPPGGLDPSETPQFILFTHDDSVRAAAFDALTAIFRGRQSANGCRPAATLFALSRGSDCGMLRQLYSEGYEVASHSLSHVRMRDFDKEHVEAEVVGGRTALAAACGIPASDIVGFRQPFLMSGPTVRKVLHEQGFLYDSTLIEELEEPLSGSMKTRLWPYSMQDGLPQNCSRFCRYQVSAPGERYPGLFEVPVWDFEPTGLFALNNTMADGRRRGVFKILKRAFDASYDHNRAPLPIYIHSSWFSADNVADMQKFADYALSKPHTYFVTMRQLLSWIQNPTPASQLTPAALGCGNPGGAGGVLPVPPIAMAPSGQPSDDKPQTAAAPTSSMASSTERISIVTAFSSGGSSGGGSSSSDGGSRQTMAAPNEGLWQHRRLLRS